MPPSHPIRVLALAALLCVSVAPAFAQSAPSSGATAAPTTRASKGPASFRVRVGENANEANLIKRVEPEYPEQARKKHLQGTVSLHVILAKDGSVKQAEPISGHPLFMKSAIDAVVQWRYRPTLLNGEPVEVDTIVDIVFALH